MCFRVSLPLNPSKSGRIWVSMTQLYRLVVSFSKLTATTSLTLPSLLARLAKVSLNSGHMYRQWLMVQSSLRLEIMSMAKSEICLLYQSASRHTQACMNYLSSSVHSSCKTLMRITPHFSTTRRIASFRRSHSSLNNQLWLNLRHPLSLFSARYRSHCSSQLHESLLWAANPQVMQ